MCDERTIAFDEVVEFPQPQAVLLDRESGHPPDDFAQQVDNRGNVVDHHRRSCGPDVDDLQPRCLRGGDLIVRIPQTDPICTTASAQGTSLASHHDVPVGGAKQQCRSVQGCVADARPRNTISDRFS